ncbi:Chorion peroxidase [Pseudolycoriella hygida]|uniref:Chorion peroxidase n=1 Tax=Pseudolycoriella hygida TaxID=35572 RepID=A0A9Q0S1X2_9DIPT|nr:Chorion peroxidase [Pseudolycoriella hygida]
MLKYFFLLLTEFLIAVTAKQQKTRQGHSIHNCEEFNSVLKKVRFSVHEEEERNKRLENRGFTYADNIFGAAPTYDTCSANIGKIARLHTVAAQYFKDKYNVPEDQFKNYVAKSPAPKYRPIDGRGNNLNNPEWGASDTPFARFGPKGYADGVNVPKKALSGAPLPNPRKIVEEALTKATRAAPPPLAYGVFALMTVLFITHDVHYQTAVQPSDAEKEIQCCLDDRSKALPASLSHPSCFPIEIAKNDTLYQQGGVGCISLVRSERAEYTDQVQAGEIMNRATSFLDLSLIYGNHQSELDPIRLYSGGLFRMGRNNLLPVDSNGKYIPSMRRFTMVPMASIWPSLFARNHNYLAQGLAEINPQWDDETLFQEARRINIALFQYNLITSKAVEASISNIPIKEEYDGTRNAATTLEFSIAYRMAHYYIHDNMLWQDENLNEKRHHWAH